MQEVVVKAGKLFCLESGEDSNYGVCGFFVALKDFDIRAELEGYFKEHPEQRQEYRGEESQFIAWLAGRGLLLDIDYQRIHVGSHSTLKIS